MNYDELEDYKLMKTMLDQRIINKKVLPVDNYKNFLIEELDHFTGLLNECENRKTNPYFGLSSEGEQKINPLKKIISVLKNELNEIKMENKEPTTATTKKEKGISHVKQMILLDELGILDFLNNKPGFGLLTRMQKAELISLIIGKNHQNTREFLTYGTLTPEQTPEKKRNYIYKTSENIEFAHQILSKFNLL